MSRRVKAEERAGGEFEVYPTPAWPVHRLLEAVPELLYSFAGDSQLWLEPCAGDGAIIKAVNVHRELLDRSGTTCTYIDWTAVEIRLEARPLLQPFVDDVIIGDFLRLAPELREEAREQGRDWRADVIITNTPYTLAREFVDAMRLLSPNVFALLRLNFLESDEREPWFRAGNLPEHIYVLPNRPQFTKGKDGKKGSDSCAYGWMYWGAKPCFNSTVSLLKSTPLHVRKQ